jgi:hypothetical protein
MKKQISEIVFTNISRLKCAVRLSAQKLSKDVNKPTNNPTKKHLGAGGLFLACWVWPHYEGVLVSSYNLARLGTG